MAAVTLPLFPLHTVLFPQGPLGLRIFEPRYLDMVRRCTRQGGSFVVVTILEGQEAGAAARIANFGTQARIVDFDPLPDGLLGISCLGGQRARVLRFWQQSDGLNLGEVELVEAPPASALPAELQDLADLLRAVLPKLGDPYAQLETRYEDAGWVADRWAEVLPLSALQKLVLLEEDDPLARLAQVAAWSGRQPPAAHV
ncbi:MAG TPA: LON peptidase substrate-binding domain-containing protein [Steroidobacteraceae bacterium]|nr:LON peptidase substrate-binding domain-containing protein [Steroidobacteraceae bacterium]